MERPAASDRTLSQFSETWVRQVARDQAPACVGWCLWAGVAGLTTLIALVLQSSV
ncbi:MAG: hypothetical protein WDO24_04285 [Pseudomonadota bacterium]